jgi:hypothetical protein
MRQLRRWYIGLTFPRMTFEPDIGGFNKVRLALETVVALAVATGRTLVIPEQMLYGMSLHIVSDIHHDHIMISTRCLTN